jgi:hypothetical protein
LLVPPSSIYKQVERHPPALSHRGAGGAGLPYLCRVRWLAFTGHGAPFLAGYGFIGMGFVQVGGEREREKWFKIFFFPASACAGKKENSAVQNGIVSVLCFFFLEKKCNLEEPKNGLWQFFGLDNH